MVAEAVAAAIVGVLALWLVLRPLTGSATRSLPPSEPVDPEETPKGIALAALKEIEFDRETGKLSDADYEYLKAKYTGAALEALRADSDDVEAMIAARMRAVRSAPAPASSAAPAEPAPVNLSCPTCGPRPEADAVFCSSCGCHLPTRPVCESCGAPLLPDSRFCDGCGRQVAA
jgi:hypothetical protein